MFYHLKYQGLRKGSFDLKEQKERCTGMCVYIGGYGIPGHRIAKASMLQVSEGFLTGEVSHLVKSISTFSRLALVDGVKLWALNYTFVLTLEQIQNYFLT